jgi:hypothetical protein
MYAPFSKEQETLQSFLTEIQTVVVADDQSPEAEVLLYLDATSVYYVAHRTRMSA